MAKPVQITDEHLRARVLELVAERPTIPRLWFYQALAYMLN